MGYLGDRISRTMLTGGQLKEKCLWSLCTQERNVFYLKNEAFIGWKRELVRWRVTEAGDRRASEPIPLHSMP